MLIFVLYSLKLKVLRNKRLYSFGLLSVGNLNDKKVLQMHEIKHRKCLFTGSRITSNNLALFCLVRDTHPHVHTPVVSGQLSRCDSG